MRVREGGGGREGKIRLVTCARFSYQSGITVICYIASQSHMTCMLVKLINDHGYKVLLINRTRYHVPPGFIGEQSFRAKKN